MMTHGIVYTRSSTASAVAVPTLSFSIYASDVLEYIIVIAAVIGAVNPHSMICILAHSIFIMRNHKSQRQVDGNGLWGVGNAGVGTQDKSQ